MRLEKLSTREKQVISLKMDGLCDKEIAGELNISYGTVRSHIDRAKLKLKCSNTYQLIAVAREMQHI